MKHDGTSFLILLPVISGSTNIYIQLKFFCFLITSTLYFWSFFFFFKKMAIKRNRTRQIILIAVLAIVAVFIFLKSSKAISTKDLHIVDEVVFSLNSRSNDQISNEARAILRKFEETANKLVEQQSARLDQLEEQRRAIEKQLQELRRPPAGASFREQLAYLFPYDQSKRFPAYIWQTWKYGLNDERFGELLTEGERSWTGKNPGFVKELFNDDTATAVIRHLYIHLPQVLEAWNAMPTTILRMDFFRYLMLFARGGVYADIDTMPLQPVPNWIPENVQANELGMIIGLEADPSTSPKDWKGTYARRIQFCNWVFQAKPGHPILREVVARITENTLERKKNNDLKLSEDNRNIEVMNWTGAGIWTDIIFTYFNDYVQSGVFSQVTWRDFSRLEIPRLVSDVLVLPITSFSPGIGIMGAKDEDHPLAFVKHYFHALWKEDN